MEQIGSVERSGVRRAETYDCTVKKSGDAKLDMCETGNT